MENNELVKYKGGLINWVGNAVLITSKLLAKIEPKLIPYRKKNKWGFCTADKEIVIDCIYECAKPFSNDLAPVQLNRKWGFIDTNGNLRIDTLYIEVNKFSSGLSGVKRTPKGKWGFIDVYGNLVIDFKYYGAEEFINGAAQVIIVNELLDLSRPHINVNDEIVNVSENDVDFEKQDLILYDDDGYYGFRDKNGINVIECKYSYASNFNQNFALVVDYSGYSFYIDKSGTEYFES